MLPILSGFFLKVRIKVIVDRRFSVCEEVRKSVCFEIQKMALPNLMCSFLRRQPFRRTESITSMDSNSTVPSSRGCETERNLGSNEGQRFTPRFDSPPQADPQQINNQFNSCSNMHFTSCSNLETNYKFYRTGVK